MQAIEGDEIQPEVSIDQVLHFPSPKEERYSVREPEKSIRISQATRNKGDHTKVIRPVWRSLYTVSDHVGAFFESNLKSLPFLSEEEYARVSAAIESERISMPSFSIYSPQEAPFVIRHLYHRYVHYLFRYGFTKDKTYPTEMEGAFKADGISPASVLVVATLPQPVTDFRSQSLLGPDFMKWVDFSNLLASVEMEALLMAGRDESVHYYRLNEPKVHISGKNPFYFVFEARLKAA